MKNKIKDWLYRKFISKGLLELKQEAYEKGYSNGKKEWEEYVNSIVNQMYSEKHWVVNPDHVLTATENLVFLNGEQISEIEARELRAEAKTFANMRLYKIFEETLRQKAIEKSVKNSDASVLRDVNPELIAGKMIIHSIGIMNSIIKTLAK